MRTFGPTVAGLTIDFGQITERIPRGLVDAILKETKRESLRIRKLPAYLMVYYEIALGLMNSGSARHVLRELVADVRDEFPDPQAAIASRTAISNARQRLGAEPIRKLYEQVVKPIAKRTTSGAWFGSRRLVALDGSSLHVKDSPGNRKEYGKAGAAKGKASPLPLIRWVALCELGTHVVFAARMAAWKVSELALAKQLIHRLEPGMLCLADRLFYGFPLWSQAVATGADLLWRVQKGVTLPPLKRLRDGSYLSQVRGRSNGPVAERRRSFPVRVIEFYVKVGRSRKHYRLITTLLDPRKAPAKKLAELYAKRWGIETVIGEVKTYLKGPGTLRSELPELVEQDFYGLLLAHFGVRSIMHEAALQQRIPPTELSFIHSVRVVIRRLPEMVSFSPLWWLSDAPSAAGG
ncbi:MAG TPA: IS4 family transposase [Thermoanaerobaculia bacterium]|nr:IS4 family transposase [Thermoanaerobaculia bacterium]